MNGLKEKQEPHITTVQRIREKLHQILGLDLRSLATVRITLSFLNLLDLCFRVIYLHDHYDSLALWTFNDGMKWNPWVFSLHYMSGTLWFQGLMFAINALCTFCFLIGYKTRISGPLTWVMVVSMHNRNMMINNGGDEFFRIMLFWLLFLPSGARYSVDAALDPQPPHITSPNYLSLGTIAYLVQFHIMYYYTAVLKYSKEWHEEGSAVYYALNLDQFTTRTGYFMLQFPGLLRVLTRLVWLYELWGPFVLYSPVWTGPLRTAAVAGFVLMHFGFGMCLNVGFFMYIPPAVSLAFLPAWWWDTVVLPRVRNSRRRFAAGLRVYYWADRWWTAPKRLLAVFAQFFLTADVAVTCVSDPAVGAVDSASPMTEIAADMRRKNTSVLAVDSGGTAYFGFDALFALARASPILWPCSHFWKIRGFRRVGKSVWEAVDGTGTGRRWTERVMRRALPWRPGEVSAILRRRWIAELFALFVLVAVVQWNRAGYHKLPVAERYAWISPILRLDQWWGMFSPHPPKDDGWFVMPAQLRNGTVFDVFRSINEAGPFRVPTPVPLVWDKPKMVTHQFANQRWRKWIMNLYTEKSDIIKMAYGKYMCREWNWWGRHPGDQQMVQFEIVFMREWTLPDYKTAPPEKVVLWRHSCF